MKTFPYVLLLLVSMVAATVVDGEPDRPRKPINPFEYRWGDLIIPKVDFYDTSLVKVVEFFNDVFASSGTGRPSVKVGIRWADGSMAHTSKGGSNELRRVAKDISVSLQLRNISAGAALRYVGKITDLKIEASEQWVVFLIPNNEFHMTTPPEQWRKGAPAF